MFGFLWSLVVGGVIGWLAGMIIGRDVPFGVIGNILAGFIGAWLASFFFRDFGPIIGGFAIIPALLGAILLVFLVSLIFRGMKKAA